MSTISSDMDSQSKMPPNQLKLIAAVLTPGPPLHNLKTSVQVWDIGSRSRTPTGHQNASFIQTMMIK